MKSRLFISLLLILSVNLLQAGNYSLEQYLKLVEENSKDLMLARYDRRLAENRKDQATAAVRPMIAGDISYSRNLLEISQSYPVGASPMADPDYGFYPLLTQDVVVNKDNDYSMSFGIQQTIFDMNVFKALEASSKYIELTGSVYEATRQGILTGAKKVYFQTVLLEEVYEVKKATEQNAYEAWKDIQLKYQNDLASELNVLQAEVNWQMKIPETSQAARNRDLALSNLKHMAGISQEEKITLTDELIMLEETPAQINFGEILGSRPDYQALQIGSQLNGINISSKKAEFFPKLTASAGYGWKKSDNAFDLSEGINAVQAGVKLTIPVFYGGVRFSQLEQARIEAEKTQMEILKKHDEIQREVSNLNLLINESMDRIESAEVTLNTAEKAYSIVEISSKNGLAAPLDLKDALLNLEGARLNYYSAVYDYLDAYFSWQQAVGRGDQLPGF